LEISVNLKAFRKCFFFYFIIMENFFHIKKTSSKPQGYGKWWWLCSVGKETDLEI